MVEDLIEGVDLIPYYCAKLAFNFKGWVEVQTALLVLQSYSGVPAIIAPSTDSNPDEVISSTSIQFRPLAA